jgi:cyclopropane fatty-acyl-phospholipid synthase-like methyltransferase
VNSGAKDVVAAGYDAIVDRYATWQSQIVGDPRERYVQKLLSLLPEHADILEIGCGGGVEPTPTFATRSRLVGIDISRAQVDRARAAIPEAEFIHADVTTSTFAPGSFDAVVALFVLTHIPGAELPGLLVRVGRWLRTGGVFLATFGSGSRHETVVDDWLGVPMFFSGFEEETNERLVQEAGLTVVESRLESIQEPESEPGRGPETVSFHWILAAKR